MQNLNIIEIMKKLPHRYPFLLIDKIIAYEVAKSITAIKNVSINEQFFQGHFPTYPVMPGVLIVEAMAQTSGILTVLTYGERQEDEMYFFAGIDKARFKRQVIPGDQLRIEVVVQKVSRGLGKYKACAFVDDKLACEAEIMVIKGGIDGA